MAEFSFENAEAKGICYCKQRMKWNSLSSECVERKHCKPCTSFTSHLYSWYGMVWYRTLRVKRKILNKPQKNKTTQKKRLLMLACISFKHSLIIGTTELYILIPVLMTLSFTQGHCYTKNIFSQISQLSGMKCSMLLQAIGLLKLMLDLLATINIQGRELYLRDFIEYAFNIGCIQMLVNHFVLNLIWWC